MTPTRNAPGPGAPAAVVAASERPLTARSVVASTLLGMHPPRLPTLILVRSGALFGIPEGTTRVALSRMAAAGELEPDGDGYRLAGRLRTRQERQDLSLAGPPSAAPWDGSWSLAVVTADGRRPARDRSDLRAAARLLRLAEWREGVWARPANLPAGLLPEAESTVADQCSLLRAVPDDDPATLAASLWDLDAWAARARLLVDRLAGQGGALADGDLAALAPAFVTEAAALRHLQSDPLLPPPLLPAEWPGDDLRSAYVDQNRSFRALWRDWYRAQLAGA